MEEPKKLEIVSGDVEELEISEVYDHLNIAKPKAAKEEEKEKKKEIVIPHIKKKIDIKKKKDKN